MNEGRIEIENRIRKAGLKVTSQRYAVLEFLLRTDEHPTAERIGAELNRMWPAASRATIYNALNVLRDANLVQEVHTDAATRYEAASVPHHHFLCRVCGSLRDLGSNSLQAPVEMRIGDGAIVEEVTVIAKGICSVCSHKYS